MEPVVKLDGESGNLTINVFRLLDGISREDTGRLADALACLASVIEYVAKRLCTGYAGTPGRGARNDGDSESRDPLDVWRAVVAKSAGDAARRKIEALESCAIRASENADRFRDWAFELKDALYGSGISLLDFPDFEPAAEGEYEVVKRGSGESRKEV